MPNPSDWKPPYETDPRVRVLTAEKIDDDIREYLSLLDNEDSEHEIHKFLCEHSYFFERILNLSGYSPLYSKVKLGTEFETDFAFFDSHSFGIEWHLIEIERPSKTLFTATGNPSADLTQAVQQIRDWQDWIHSNLDYARKIMPNIDYAMGHLFIGRRSGLSSENRIKLHRYCYDHRMLLEIHTLDNFADQALDAKSRITPDGGKWWIPMQAYSHSDLANKLPAAAFDKLRDPHTVRATLDFSGDRLSNLKQEVRKQAREEE